MQFIEQANKHHPTINDISGYKHWHLQRRKVQEQSRTQSPRAFWSAGEHSPADQKARELWVRDWFKSNSVLDVRTHFKPTETFQHGQV